MIVQPWTAETRANLLRELIETKKQRGKVLDQEDWAQADVLMAKLDGLTESYYAGLPRFIVSCCPFDGKPLVRTFDPMGLDGLWWHPTATPEELPACPHFLVFSGAVSYMGLPPIAGEEDTFPGPEIPFVYPRLLALPGVVAVISSLPMENGYLAYPIGYFAEKRPPAEQLVADWRRTQYHWDDQLGNSGWRIENDKWDFDLRPWLQQDKVRWTPPGSDRAKLAAEPWERCPYLDLPGKPKMVSIWRDKCGYLPPPDGSYISPYED